MHVYFDVGLRTRGAAISILCTEFSPASMPPGMRSLGWLSWMQRFALAVEGAWKQWEWMGTQNAARGQIPFIGDQVDSNECALAPQPPTSEHMAVVIGIITSFPPAGFIWH